MGVNPATFSSGGLQSQHYLPGAYSRLNFIKGSGGLVSIANAVIMGDSRGGEPNKVHWFGSAAEAQETLISGPLLDAVRHAFSVGGGLIPQMIGAVRVNPGTQAARIHENGSTTIIDVTAWDYGLYTNQLKSKLEAGTVTGKKLTIKFQNNDEEIWDDIERESLQIQYTGAGSAATMNITKTQLDTTCTGEAGDDLVMLFSAFPTIEDLVNYINDQTAYTASILTGNSSEKTTELDTITAQDIKTSAYDAMSDLQAIIDTLNASPWIGSASFDVSATRLIPDNDANWVYFSGAIDGTYTSSEWGVSLTYLEGQDVQLVGSSVEDASIHALIKTHCESMCSVTGKSERQFILGGAAGETPAQAKTRVANLGSEYGMIAFPGFTHYDYDSTIGETKTWSPAYYAAKLIGAFSVLALNEPHTYKVVDVLGWEDELTRTEVEDLIKNGVCCGIRDKTGRKISARTINTYQGNELQKCEFSMMREALFMSRDLRTAVEKSFVGKAMSNGLIGKVDVIVTGKLSQYYDLGLYNGDPPYWGYNKTIVGDKIRIDYNCYLTPPTNFIFVTSHMHVYASTSG